MVSQFGPRGMAGVASWRVECKTLTDWFLVVGRAAPAKRGNGVAYCGRSDWLSSRKTYLTYHECEHRRVQSRDNRSHRSKCGEKLSSHLNGTREEKGRIQTKPSVVALKKSPVGQLGSWLWQTYVLSLIVGNSPVRPTAHVSQQHFQLNDHIYVQLTRSYQYIDLHSLEWSKRY
jgi:hypothetical protein